MKISTKIILLVSFFLVLLTIEGLSGAHLLSSMSNALRGVVNRDLVLMQSASEITRDQLQKAVVFERLRRISEELAYQETSPARKDHLVFHAGLAKKNFDELAKEGALNIVASKRLLGERIRNVSEEDRKKAQPLLDVLREIEKAHIHYDSLVGDIFSMVQAGRYEVSADDIAQIQRDEKKLTGELQKMIDLVDALTKGSLALTEEREAQAQQVLWAVLAATILTGLALAFWIIRAVDEPLKSLETAAHELGAGDLTVRLAESSRDEIGEVSRAFNTMAARLQDAQQKLESQSQVLQKNLEITEQQKKDLEKVNRELDRFVQTVSHDIRSPLMSISWYADFLKGHHYNGMDDKGRECLEGVVRGVEKANNLIRDLLTLTRISRVRNPYSYVQTGAMIDDVLATLEYRIKQNNVLVKVQPNMPSIICDGIKMKEVFLNLLTNAIKFSCGNHEHAPQVELAYLEHAQSHEFFVKDNGIGIDPRYHDEIFMIFKRLDNSEKYEGTGTGLSIVKTVIDDHGGKVWVESALGQGASFHFMVPKGLEAQSPIVS